MSAPEIDQQFEAIVDSPTDGKFAAAFSLPETWSEELVTLHAEIVADMRREARNLPMNSVQTLLLERVAYKYCEMKYLELSGERLRPAQMQDLLKQWREMTTEFNKQLGASHMRLREALLSDIRDIVMSAIGLVESRENRDELRAYLAKKFEEIGE